MNQSVKDKFANQIYITDERWEHIHKRHPETIGFEKQIIKTIRSGNRIQLPLDLDVFKYKKSYVKLPKPHTQIVVVVKFSHKLNQHRKAIQNNFVITAFMK
ncbi:hypothetical protein H8E88_34270 [candidate division KSB1 bacterium]|nr:hypothetical protein [candidate division KSB1 bacterium]MBL7092732.1 hypothetical protein [candidate division KSB1 bacterium]